MTNGSTPSHASRSFDRASWAIVGIFLVVLVVGGVYVYNGGSFSGIKQSTTDSTKNNNVPIDQTAGTQCNIGGQNPVWRAGAYVLDPLNNNQLSYRATDAYIAVGGLSAPATNFTTLTTGPTNSPSDQLTCGATYRQIVGNGNTVYYSKSADTKIQTTVVPAPNGGQGLAVVPSGASVVTISNNTGAVFSNAVAFNWSASGYGAGGTSQSDISVKTKSPAAPASFGNLAHALCFIYDSANLTSVKAYGGKQVSIFHVKPVGSLNTVGCFEFPVVPNLGSQPFEVYGLEIKAASGVLPNTTITIVDVDKTDEKYNNWLVPTENAQAGVNANGYDLVNDPNTGTGSADVTVTGAITIVP